MYPGEWRGFEQWDDCDYHCHAASYDNCEGVLRGEIGDGVSGLGEGE